MSPTEALPTKIWPRVDAAPSPPIHVLISVPDLRLDRSLGHRSRRGAEVLPRSKRLGRRRLRREVRLTAYTSLTVVGLSLAWGVISPNGADRTQAVAIRWTWPRWCLPAGPSGFAGVPPGRAFPDPLPRVLLSIEPVGTTAESDAEAPVVFPGYLLPADTHEESAHEGS
jgi:hypothetical protein